MNAGRGVETFLARENVTHLNQNVGLVNGDGDPVTAEQYLRTAYLRGWRDGLKETRKEAQEILDASGQVEYFDTGTVIEFLNKIVE